jgi:hypothetical protein
MVSIAASVLSSLVAWAAAAMLEGHISDAALFIVSTVIWSIVFVPTFVWIKRLRDG